MPDPSLPNDRPRAPGHPFRYAAPSRVGPADKALPLATGGRRAGHDRHRTRWMDGLAFPRRLWRAGAASLPAGVGLRWRALVALFQFYLDAFLDLGLSARPTAPTELFVGHSPVGALSVFAMLAVLVVQVATGLVSDDEVSTSGPLTRFVSNAVVGQATGWHTGVGQWLVIGPGRAAPAGGGGLRGLVTRSGC